MSVVNLTRYTEFLRYDGHTSAALMVESPTGAYVKFEEAKVASSNSVQQLKAEIAVGLSKIELYISTGRGEYLEDGCNYLRQLSAV